MKTEIEQTLNIYSLVHNESLEQAINYYQRKNPSIKVNIEIGIDNQSSVTLSDAIRKLNTDILANGDIDILIADGLNVENYSNSNYFVNIKDILQEILKDNNLFENVVSSYEKNDEVYILPTRFSMMGVVGDSTYNNGFKNVDDLTMALENLENKSIPIFYEHGFNNIMEIYFYMFFQAEDKIEKQDLESFYKLLNSIYTLYQDQDIGEEGKETLGQFSILPLSAASIDSVIQNESQIAIDYISSSLDIRR